MRKIDNATGTCAVTFQKSDFSAAKLSGIVIHRIIASHSTSASFCTITVTNNDAAGPDTLFAFNFEYEPCDKKLDIVVPFKAAAGLDPQDDVVTITLSGDAGDCTLLVEAGPLGG